MRIKKIAVLACQEVCATFWWIVAPSAMRQAEERAREALCGDPGLCGEGRAGCHQGCRYWHEVYSPSGKDQHLARFLRSAVAEPMEDSRCKPSRSTSAR